MGEGGGSGEGWAKCAADWPFKNAISRRKKIFSSAS